MRSIDTQYICKKIEGRLHRLVSQCDLCKYIKKVDIYYRRKQLLLYQKLTTRQKL